MRVGIFGSKYQVEKQSQIKRLFEKLISQEAEIYVDVRFYNFINLSHYLNISRFLISFN